MGKQMDRKEKLLISMYCNRFYQHTFDETDLFAFLILIRSHVSRKDQKYIIDFADLIAHRKRDRGIALDAVAKAITHGYNEVRENGHIVVEGYHGVDLSEWRKEWIRVGNRFGYNFDRRTIDEITLCILSILQFTRYQTTIHPCKWLFWKKIKVSATVFLLQSDDGQLAAATLEDGKNDMYINFLFRNGVCYKKLYSGRRIEDPVVALRADDGMLILKNDKGERIV